MANEKKKELPRLLYTRGEVAELLGITDRTLRTMVANKTIPRPIAVNQRLSRWPCEVIVNWIQGGMKPCR